MVPFKLNRRDATGRTKRKREREKERQRAREMRALDVTVSVGVRAERDDAARKLSFPSAPHLSSSSSYKSNQTQLRNNVSEQHHEDNRGD